jgi:hypothetical protein
LKTFTRRLSGFALGAALLVAGGAQGQMYRWVDDRGVVNYSDQPPPARSRGARTLAEGAGNVSVVPGLSKEELQRVRERDEQQRLQQLERENEELRARERARASAPPEAVYTEVYVPAYGYGQPPRRRPPDGAKGGQRPEQPIAKPKPPGKAGPTPDLPGGLFTGR